MRFSLIGCAGGVVGLVLLTTAAGRPGPLWRFEARSIDGRGNNLAHPEWGAASTPVMRMCTAMYADGMAAPAGDDRPGARIVSNMVCAQTASRPNSSGATDFIWQWGQFIDHDITLIDAAQPLEHFNIPVPAGDPFFDPAGTGNAVIPLDRSEYDPASGDSPGNPRQQMQLLTSFVDGSMVYGADAVRAAALRANDGTGRLKTSDGDLLPYNVPGLPNFGGPSPELFLAGDIRANEQASLTVMHTLWVREHNAWADHFRARHPRLDGDEIYELARRWVGAEIQAITYYEFLPLLLGPEALPEYRGYDPDVNPTIANEFAAAAYRVGHTLLSPVIRRREADGSTSIHGDLPLRNAFFALHVLTDEGGLEPILRGLAAQPAQDIDRFVIDDVRNFLFGPPGAGGFDLPSLNIQRGRDHGLPGYNQLRAELGLEPADDFSDISADPAVQQALEAAYGDVDKIDLWVGGISEDHMPGAMVGEVLMTIIGDQFARLRDGDRFWFEGQFGGEDLQQLRRTRLADVIRRNTDIGDEIQDDVFHLPPSCPGDVNDDAAVDVSDVLAILLAVGTADGDADLNHDGVVNVADLLLVLRSIGPCESD